MPIAYNEQTGEAKYLDDSGQWVNARIAENPETKERLAFDGKNWVGLQKAPVRSPSLGEQAVRGLRGGLMALQQGLTYGLGDEAASAITAGAKVAKSALTPGEKTADFSEEYNRSLQRHRAELRDFANDHPVAAMANEIVGGLLAPGSSAGSIVREGPGVVTALRNIGQAAKVGAVQGGLYGYGAGEGGVADRATSAASGAALGGIGGAALSTAGLGLAALGRSARNAYDEVFPANVRETAMRKIETSLARDKKTPAELAQRLQDRPELIPAAGSGRGLQGLADAVVTRPGESGQRAAVLKEAIAEKSSNTASADLRSGLGTAGEFYDTLATLDATKRQAAAPLWEKVYAHEGNVWNDDLKKLASRPSVKDAMGRAYRIAAEEDIPPELLGLRINERGETEFTKVPTMRTLDYIKRGLDDVVEGYRDTTTGRLALDTQGRAVNETRAEWLKALDAANPDYKAAREAWAGPTRAQAAMREGEQFIKERPEEIAATLKEMGASERDYYRLGVERRILDVIENTNDGGDVFKQLIRTERKRNQLKALYPSEAEYQKFIDTARDRIANYNTLSRALGGSPTEPRRQAAADFERRTGLIGEIAESAVTGGRQGAINAAFRSGAAYLRAPREDVANEVGAMLLPLNQIERQAFIDRLLNGPPPGTRVPPATLAFPRSLMSLSQIAGQQAGLAQAPNYEQERRR